MRKNVAGQAIGAQMTSATDGSAFTGSVTVYVTGDGGVQAVGSVGSGACTHEGNGYHSYAPAQAETNYNLIAFTFIGTGAIAQTIQVPTTGYDHTAASIPATIAAGAIATDAITAAAVKADAVTKIQAGLPAAVWDYLTSAATTVGSIGKALVDFLLAYTTARGAKLDRLDRLPDAGTVAIPGDAMTLTSGEREATAVVVESHLLDEGDSQLLINAIRADLERSGGNLHTLLARLTSTRADKLDNLDATVASRLPTASYTDPDNAGITEAVSQATAAAGSASSAASGVSNLSGRIPDALVDGRIKADATVDTSGIADDVVEAINETGVEVSRLQDEALDQLRAAEIELGQWDPTTEPADIYRGIDHLNATGNAFHFRNAEGTWPNLTDCTVRMELRIEGVTAIAGQGTIVVASGANQHVYIEVLRTAFDESSIKDKTGVFRVVRIDGSGNRFPLANGIGTLHPNTAPAG